MLAIPGSIHATQSKGCHWLIKQGAKLVESAQDVLEEMQLPVWPQTTMGPATDPALTDPALTESALTEPAFTDPASHPDAAALLLVMGHDPVSLDALQARCGWSTALLQAQLLELELMGQVGRLPGGLFQQTHRA